MESAMARDERRLTEEGDIEMAPADSLLVTCTLSTPLRDQYGHHQLRCRFYRNDNNNDDGRVEGAFSEFPAQLPQPANVCNLHCNISAQDLNEGARVAIVLPSGEELVCQSITCDHITVQTGKIGEATAQSLFKKLSILDRFLYVWILLDMVLAILMGNYIKNIKKAFQVVELASVSLPIAIGLWVMMYPVLCKVHYELLGQMFRDSQLVKQLLLSVILNWVVGPALMTGLAWAALPDLPNYRTGVILVGIARCIAMVLIWNDLAKGDRQLCAVLVAINSILQMVLFTPVSLFYIKVVSREDINVGFWIIAKSVLLFLGVPLASGIITRYSLKSIFGRRWYDSKFLPAVGPWALIGLLFTIFVMFSVQADQILHNKVHALRVAVPLLCYFGIVFWSSLGICQLLKIPYPKTITQSFTAASNNFELAIAIAVGSFGIDSQEALAATIGPLIEVPVLLSLVYVTLHLQKWMTH